MVNKCVYLYQYKTFQGSHICIWRYSIYSLDFYHRTKKRNDIWYGCLPYIMKTR